MSELQWMLTRLVYLQIIPGECNLQALDGGGSCSKQVQKVQQTMLA